MDFKFKTSFSATLKPLVSEEKDKYLALASLKDIGSFIPNIDTRKDVDLLPVAFNACVINRVNKNGDVIDTATALEIYKNFINKPINIEHNRQHILGTILTAGFSSYGTDLPLSAEDLVGTKQPFNITLGGVLWKIVNPDLTDKIEASNDEDDDDYQSISASWELGFSEYTIVSSEDESKNLEDCEEESEPLEYDQYLKSNGGTGKTKDGKNVYRKVVGAVVPLGIGLTENPAADVKGVAVLVEDDDSDDKEDETEDETEDEIEDAKNKEIPKEGCSENISQSSDLNVKLNSNKIMKINSLEEINEANWKEISASAVTQFVAEQLKTANDEFLAKKAEHDNFIKATEESAKKAQEDYASLKATLDTLQAELTKLTEEKSNREQVDVFNGRMTDMCSAYELTDEMTKVVAAQVKACKTDEDFSAYKTSMEVFLKPFEKQAPKEAAASTEEEKAKEQAKEKESHASVVDNAVDNSTKEKTSIPNSTETKKATVFEKYSQAFSLEDGFIVNKNRR